ncbi:MAG: hypothetical protein ABW007_27695 [Chitinophagaceae bacterium]
MQMLEFPLSRGDSLVYAMHLIYNFLDTDEVIENDVFYFNPNSDDEDMPSFWLKELNIQIAWYRDNPDRGASSNAVSMASTAFFILSKVKGAIDGYDTGRKTSSC